MKRFIKIVGKVPLVNWQDENNRFELKDLINEKSIGFVPEEGLIVVDTDSKEATEYVENVNAKLGLKPFSYESSTDHKHYYYKLTDGHAYTTTEQYPTLGSNTKATMRELVKYITINVKGEESEQEGTQIDLKGNDRGYVGIKKYGNWRVDPTTFIQTIETYPHPELPKVFALPSTMKANKGTSHSDTELVQFATLMATKGMQKQYFIELVLEHQIITGGISGYSIDQTRQWAADKYDKGELFAKQNDKKDNYVEWFNQKQNDKNVVVKIYKAEYYHLNNNIWKNVSREMGTKELTNNYLAGLVKRRDELDDSGKIAAAAFVLKADLALNHVVQSKDINKNIAVFKNGYFDLETKSFVPNKIPFTTSQKTYDWNDKVKNDLMERFINELSGNDKAKRKLLLEVIGSAFFPHNPSVFTILHSNHSTSGKGSIIEIVKSATKSSRELKDSQVFGVSNRFAMSAIKGVDSVFFDELPMVIDKETTKTIKSFADSKSEQEIEGKGTNQEAVNNSPTIIALTNKELFFHDLDNALEKRLIYLNIEMNKDGVYLFNTKEITQLINNEEGLQYLASEAIKAYAEVFHKDGIRNMKFSLTQEHNDWIESKRLMNNDLVKEVVDADDILSRAIEDKEEFISNATLQNAYEISKVKENNPKFTFQAFKNDFMDYLSKQKHTIMNDVKKIGGKTYRGFKIKWYAQKVDVKLENIEL